MDKPLDNYKQLKEFRQNVGLLIYFERRRQGLTLSQMARKADLKPGTIDQIEIGRGPFDAFIILRIANALKIPLDTFLYKL